MTMDLVLSGTRLKWERAVLDDGGSSPPGSCIETMNLLPARRQSRDRREWRVNPTNTLRIVAPSTARDQDVGKLAG
jgi:hypothetical protein